VEVQPWAKRDEHKARLSMVDRGCLLWRVRRYLTMAFYEPITVYLVVLAMWPYGSYAVSSRDGEKKDPPPTLA
jgi:hypothetical protein